MYLNHQAFYISRKNKQLIRTGADMSLPSAHRRLRAQAHMDTHMGRATSWQVSRWSQWIKSYFMDIDPSDSENQLQQELQNDSFTNSFKNFLQLAQLQF